MGVSAKMKNAISTYVWVTLLVMREEAIVLGKKGGKKKKSTVEQQSSQMYLVCEAGEHCSVL